MNAAAAAAGSTAIYLSWAASTDNVAVTGYLVERCQGADCSNFAQVGTSTSPSYSDTGLSASTSYSYRVRATDAGGNLSLYSNTAAATTGTTPPTAPTNLAATAQGGTQINLTWTASSSTLGIAAYLVERCQGGGCTNFTQIGTITTTAYNDTGLTSAISYSYRVRAQDTAGNLSGYSNTASATTADTLTPTAPSNLTSAPVSTSQINLVWAAAADNVGVTGYLIERCQDSGCSNFAQIATIAATSYSTVLTASTMYSYRVCATDAAGNLSGYSNVATTSTLAPDTTPPTAPANLAATAAGSAQINLSWSASTDNVGVTGYLIERCQGAGCTTFAQIATTATTSYSDTGLTRNTSYTYQVLAADAAGNLSGYSNRASATTAANTGLVAAYGFEEGSGTTVQDSSGNRNTGTISNATWTASGKYGKALMFNGTNARINIADSASLHLSSGMTLEAWVSPAATVSSWRDLIYKQTDIYYLEAGSDSGVPALGGTFAGSNDNLFATSRLAVHTWTHVAATYDGSTLRIHINGTQVSSKARTGAITSSTGALSIGGDPVFGQYFNGAIDEVRIYNRALSQAEIQTDMNTPVAGGAI
jgi:fibronectin type 3 domain-containing protein